MKKYLIIGERCQDIFVYGKSNRLSPEARSLLSGLLKIKVLLKIFSHKKDWDILIVTK